MTFFTVSQWWYLDVITSLWYLLCIKYWHVIFTFINTVYKTPYISRYLFHYVKQMKLKMQPIGCNTTENSPWLCSK